MTLFSINEDLRTLRFRVGGYEAPSTDGVYEDLAVLEMPMDEGTLESVDFLPQNLSLFCTLEAGIYENDCTVERIVNGRSFGMTPLYKRGHVQYGASEMLKPHSKVQWVDFIFLGKGFYQNADHQWVPFSADSWLAENLSKRRGESLYRKPFAVTRNSLVLETEIQPNGEVLTKGLEVTGYPRYSYGGYFPPVGGLEDIEQVYCFPMHQRYGDTERTALGLERSSDYQKKGIRAPEDFLLEGQHYVFMNPPDPGEGETLADTVLRGALKTSVTCQEKETQYGSFFYGALSKDRKVQIYFSRN
ncbi:MAG: hypothetical protein WCG05_05660 [Alphaproteobacteria bacterium]